MMTTITGDDIVPVSKVPSAQQLSFMHTLHSDVAIEIFSYLSQQDCLTSMAVCRDWYHAIPQYTQKIWRELRFKEGDVRADNHRRQRCLGSHVKMELYKNRVSSSCAMCYGGTV
ncbi:hypothetical protein BJV82DRAFT_295314 [Fennellomyces sp. T-0311]|nr:hypothetical protein BJV82DRAFT_295314 [Fennellomyces sp. T-0311]